MLMLDEISGWLAMEHSPPVGSALVAVKRFGPAPVPGGQLELFDSSRKPILGCDAPTMIACANPGCEREFVAKGDGALYCGPACRVQAATKRLVERKQQDRAGRGPLLCALPGCRNQVRARKGGSGRQTKYCCVQHRASVIETKRLAKLAAARKDRPERECAFCGKVFRPRTDKIRSCSNECAKRVGALNGHDVRTRREAALAGVEVVAYSRLDIFRRDNWTCGICGQPVDRDARFPHFLSPSIDHIVPMCHGGADRAENVRCAHWGCNLAKGQEDKRQKV